MKKFEVVFLEEVEKFLDSVESKAREKIIYNIEKSTYYNDPELFKKLNNVVWEFRTKYRNTQYRLFAFWDKRNKKETLVVSTHGFIKKTKKTPKKEIERTEKIAKEYLDQ